MTSTVPGTTSSVTTPPCSTTRRILSCPSGVSATQAQFGGIGYLNSAWAAHYFRGALAAGKINIGCPITPVAGRSPVAPTVWVAMRRCRARAIASRAPVAAPFRAATGAVGIDNIWHDLDKNGKEIGGGAVPMWHAKNLEHAASLGITTLPSYGQAWGLIPTTRPT